MRTFLFLAAVPLLTHCIKSRPVADVSHKSETFVNGTFPWQWAAPSSEQRYLRSMGVPTERSEAARRVESHLQGRLDAMVARAKERRPDRLTAVPVPKVIIVDDGTVNAWVKPVVACIPMKIALTPAPASAAGVSDTLHMIYDLSNRSLSLATNRECAALAAAPDLKAFVGWWNGKRIACKLKEVSGAVLPDAACVSAADLALIKEKGYSQAVALQMPVAAPYLFVGSGMVQAASNEAQLLGVVAHELTHYLMSHFTNEDREKYGYFYSDPAHASDGYPKPDAALAALGNELRGFEQEIAFAKVDGQRFHSATFRASVDFAAVIKAQSLCGSEARCLAACGELERFSKSADFARLSEIPPIILNAPPRFPFAPLESELLPVFRRFEEQVEQCSPFVELARTDQGGPQFRDALVGVLSLQKREAVAAELARTKTRLELLRLVSSIENRSDQRKSELYARLMELRGGWYTVEQEADDMGLELLTLMGGSVEDMIAFKVAFSAAKQHPDAYDIPTDACLKLRKDGWMTGGRPASVPLGAMSDNHHGSCYRIFNLDREQRIHGYKPASGTLLETAAWRELVRGTVAGR
jgi:hypothetical protein